MRRHRGGDRQRALWGGRDLGWRRDPERGRVLAARTSRRARRNRPIARGESARGKPGSRSRSRCSRVRARAASRRRIRRRPEQLWSRRGRGDDWARACSLSQGRLGACKGDLREFWDATHPGKSFGGPCVLCEALWCHCRRSRRRRRRRRRRRCRCRGDPSLPFPHPPRFGRTLHDSIGNRPGQVPAPWPHA